MKNALKKTMSLFIALAMICSMMLCVNAAGTPTLTMGSAEAAAGEDVTVAINLANNPGFITMTIQIDYDSSVMSLKSVAEKSLISGALHQDNLAADPYQMLWENDQLLSNITTESGVLAELTFTIKEGAAPGAYPVKILCVNDDPIEPNIYDADYEPVDFAAIDGVITVEGEPAPSYTYGETKFNNGALEVAYDFAGSYKLVVVAYSNDGKTLVKAEFIDVTADDADTKIVLANQISATGTSYKAMLWKDIANCMPILDAIAWN